MDPINNGKDRLEILALEDSPMDAELIYAYLCENFELEIKMDIVIKEIEFVSAISLKKYDLILADFVLPDFDGFAALEHVKLICPTTPFICVSGFIGEEKAVELLKAGATDYVSKDKLGRLEYSIIRALKESKEKEEKEKQAAELIIVNQELAFQNREKEKLAAELVLANKELTFQNAEKENHASELTEANNYLKKSLISFQKLTEAAIGAITIIVEKRDPYTAGHQQRVSELACAIAKEMGLDGSFIEGIRIAGLLHDVGKIAIPIEILSKPGKLSEDEFRLIKVHPKASYDILKDIEFSRPVADIILQHHERLDGSGYPNGLKGDEISMDARILNVSDVVEAMSSYRPYRPALGLDKALIEIHEHKGTLYDEMVVDTCTRLLTSRIFEFQAS